MSDFFHPKLQAVEALAPYRLRTTWSTGEVLDVDVETALRGIPALAKLLEPKAFAAQKPIPRAIWLACLGWEATRPKPKTLPRGLPTAREYALAHA
jgi:hypothetical protein